MGEIDLSAERDAERAVLYVAGEVDLASAPEIDGQVRSLVGADVRELVLDLSAVDFMDSTGLRTLIKARELLASVNGRLVLGPMSDAVRRLIDVSGLEAHFAPD